MNHTAEPLHFFLGANTPQGSFRVLTSSPTLRAGGVNSS